MTYPYQVEIFHNGDQFRVFIREEMVELDSDGVYIPLEQRQSESYDAADTGELLEFLKGLYEG